MNNYIDIRKIFLYIFFLSGPFLTSCVGMTASYPSHKISPASIHFVLLTPEFVSNQDKTELTQSINLPIPAEADGYAYVIKPSDILLISVPSIVSFNTGNAPSIINAQGEGYVVYDDGTIYLPYSGSVSVAGLTLRQVQDKVVQALSKYLKSPQVLVTVQDFRSQKILVTGQVQKPGYLPITNVPMTLIGALSTAGGISEIRGLNDARLIGNGNSLTQTIPEYPDLAHVTLTRAGKTYQLDVRHILSSGEISLDPRLIDGDVVFVPPVQRSDVYVLGEVIKPGLLEVERGHSNLADAIQASGGINQSTADPSRIYIVRGDYSSPTVFQLNAAQPDAFLLARKFNLEQGDVIYVTEAGATRFNRGLEQFSPALQAILSTAVIVSTTNAVNRN